MKQRNFEDTLNRLNAYLTTLDDDAFFAKLGTSLEELKCKSKGAGAKKMIELKSCPFCGSESAIAYHINSRPPYREAYIPYCLNDECFMNMNEFCFATEEEAVEAWNRRADNA
jgi:hypothetical protein